MLSKILSIIGAIIVIAVIVTVCLYLFLLCVAIGLKLFLGIVAFITIAYLIVWIINKITD